MDGVDIGVLQSQRLNAKLCQTLAQQLLDPESGDVVFSINGESNQRRHLYAWKHVLSVNSEYFSTSELES
jgi:hypothetical protein